MLKDHVKNSGVKHLCEGSEFYEKVKTRCDIRDRAEKRMRATRGKLLVPLLVLILVFVSELASHA